MRMAFRLGMASLACVAWLACNQALAQQMFPFGEGGEYSSGEGYPVSAQQAGRGAPPSTGVERTFDIPDSDPRRAMFADGEVPLVGSGPTGPASCCEVCGGGCCCPRLWSVSEGIRVFHRSRPRVVPFTSQLIVGSQAPLLTMSSRNVGFDPAAGYYTTVRRYLGRDAENRDHHLEFTYWGMVKWENMNERHGERLTAQGVSFGSLFSPFAPTTLIYDSPVGGFNRADRHVIENNSDLHSFELDLRLTPRARPDRLVLLPNGTWRRECNPGQYFSYHVGPRYLILDERFTFFSQGLIQRAAVADQMATGIYDVRARNHLVGLQVGADAIFRQCKTSWGFRAKAGPYINFASQNSSITTDAAGDPFAGDNLNSQLHDDQDVAALIGEVGAVGTYQLRPNLKLRGAWDLMWITGLALGPEQVVYNTNPVARVNPNGMLFMQGLTLELELTW